MSTLRDLIEKIEDPVLRERIMEETKKIMDRKTFGLVFEDHQPECTPLYEVPIKVGSAVTPKNSYISDVYKVIKIEDGCAVCINEKTKEQTTFALDEIVYTAQFGEAIYPYLKPIDSVCNAPDSDLWHTLIEAENYHALQLLEYLYTGKVDCIYIDPPYNTGAKDWKYNNDYVDSTDQYRHSKWLSMMKKRLELAKKLLNLENSVLIVTIDEKEYLHLGCLLEELFSEANMQMISSVINPSGVARGGEFYRTDEYIFILRFGTCTPSKLPLSEEWLTAKSTGKDSVRWRSIRRQGSHDTRADAQNQFYPIYLSTDGTQVIGTGNSLPLNEHPKPIIKEKNRITLYPIKPDGTEGCWQISQDSIANLLERGYIKVSYTKKWGYVPQYLAEGERAKVEEGLFPVLGKDQYGTLILGDATGDGAPFIPGTQWRVSSHSAREQGASMLNKIFPVTRFSFPKSLYAVHDALRFFVANNPNALIVDFFAGSGTTLHAVNLLNAEDGGHRRCILVTNNEVFEAEERSLKKQGYQRGDDEWERLGIARYVTWPRTVCSIEGHDINGKPLKGNYIGSDIPMSDGFKANAAYFKLGFLNKTSVALGRQFRALLPVLWLKAGGIGKCPEFDDGDIPDMLILPENKLAILNDEEVFPVFETQMSTHTYIETIFFVTDSEDMYKYMASNFEGKTTYQLYRDYLDNFRINTERS